MKTLKLFTLVFLQGALLGSCTKEIMIDPTGVDAGQQTEAFFNVIDFGADSTGVNDSSPAFDSILAASANTRQIEIYIPAGRYRISRRIAIDSTLFHGYNFHRGLMIRGAGQDVTELVCDND